MSIIKQSSYFIYLIFISIIFCNKSWGRNIDEVIKSKSFKVAVLKPEKDEFDTKKSNQKNEILKDYFFKYSQKKLTKKIKLEFVYLDSFSDFWKNKKGLIDDNDKSSPELFNNVDAYFEFMSISDWRTIRADFIPIIKSKYSLVCNFKVDNINPNAKDIDKVIDTINNKDINFISIKDTYLDHSLQGLSISSERIHYINSQYGIVNGMLNEKNKRCTFAETFLILSMLSKGKIYFVGYLPIDQKEMAWWVKKDNIEIKEFIKNFVEYLKESGGLNKIFLTLFGINYNFYDYIVGSH